VIDDAFEASRLIELGIPPVAGGYLDQTESVVEAIQVIRAAEAEALHRAKEGKPL